MDWNDLKVLLALSRKGSARGAAQELGVSNSTITRRLDELEHQLHTRLFERTPDGYRMTVAAEQMLPTAEHIEELVHSAERRVTGGDQHLEGPIRLTTPPVSGMGFMVKRLAEFARQYPGIELELLPSFEALDLRLADHLGQVTAHAVGRENRTIHRCHHRVDPHDGRVAADQVNIRGVVLIRQLQDFLELHARSPACLPPCRCSRRYRHAVDAPSTRPG